MDMDKSTQDYLDHYSHQLGEWLQQELKEIEERHLKNGTFGSKEYWDECKTVTSGIEFKKEELKTRSEVSHGKDRLKEEAKLILYRNGRVIYVSKSGKKYEAEFDLDTNSYKLLRFLSLETELASSKDIAKHLNDSDSSEDRIVRDTIQYIRRNKLGLTKEDDFFIVRRGKFLLNCVVELRN